ncbi:Stf0 family sulfotransferase [Deinococcus sp. KNUC1210]|nr:Stf0 family sulfotransferase [Deinococcus sp. KNUC1210]
MHPDQPHRSYIIWSSQRTGSTLLTAVLTETGLAGRPTEALNDRAPRP